MKYRLPLLFLSLLGLSALTVRDAEREPLELTYLANEGFLATVGEHTLLFDPFVTKSYAGYPGLPSDVAAGLTGAQDPFDGVDLVITSHNHGDHFQPQAALPFFAASPTTPMASTPQVVRTLKETEGWPEDAENPLVGLYPEHGKVLEHRFGEIEVCFLRIPHGGMPDIENLGALVRVGGHTVLHLGDADVDPEIFAPYAEVLKEVDLALVPYWFFGTDPGEAILERYLPARARVAMHFPKRDHEATVTSFLDNHENVSAFGKPLEFQIFE